MVDEVVLGNVMVDCDDERKLQRFYGELLGWEMCELFARPAVRSSSGIVFLFIEVDNVAEMVKKAESLGAKKAESQFGGDDFVTMFDPAGHPFCLCRK